MAEVKVADRRAVDHNLWLNFGQSWLHFISLNEISVGASERECYVPRREYRTRP